MEDLVPVLAIALIFGAPIAAWVISRVLAHQERMEMIRHGAIPPPMGNDRWARKQMKYGGWQAGPMGPGAPMGGPGAPMPGPMSGNNAWCGSGGDPSFYAEIQLRKGIRVAAVGAAILIGLSFIDSGHAGPWLLGGLIPLFVGIAQIINAVLNGAQPRFFAGGQPINSMNFGPRPNDSGPMGASEVPPSQNAGAPYGWRPGPTPGIERPVQPPDVRQ